MEVLKHEHPLSLVDLQPMYPDYEEEYDDETGDLITQQDFRCLCEWCNKDITWLHRYYYKCPNSSCNFSLHKYCAELPNTLQHASHSKHTLILFQHENSRYVDMLGRTHKDITLRYRCCSECRFDIDANIAMAWVQNRIMYHPSHKHPLVATSKKMSYKCDACGETHEGIFYLCTTCVDYFIHRQCLVMPELLIQQDKNGIFFHLHPLILSYSFQEEYREAKFNPPCRLCTKPHENLWIYKCEKCRYYVHLACAVKYQKVRRGYITPEKDLRKSSVPHLLHLPFHDETCNILKHFFYKENGNETFERNLKYICHQHPLILVHVDGNNDITRPTSSSRSNLLSCHNPMKGIKLLCNACVRPITSFPFYKCSQHCNFVLHEWCTRLPYKLETFWGHDSHKALTLYTKAPNKYFSVFVCALCKLPCNGFVYSCDECHFQIDVNCGFIPEKITHQIRPRNTLWRSRTFFYTKCEICRNDISDENEIFTLSMDRGLHVKCALFLPGRIRHKYDKHSMSLRYSPIESHKSDYFCEICEEELNPESCFYHCHQCAQSIHSSCSPLILQSEIDTSSYNGEGVYEFVNIKFGGIHNISYHPHDLYFVQGTSRDGKCMLSCGKTLQYKMIFKCMQCEFVAHLECCERYSKQATT